MAKDPRDDSKIPFVEPDSVQDPSVVGRPVPPKPPIPPLPQDDLTLNINADSSYSGSLNQSSWSNAGLFFIALGVGAAAGVGGYFIGYNRALNAHKRPAVTAPSKSDARVMAAASDAGIDAKLAPASQPVVETPKVTGTPDQDVDNINIALLPAMNFRKLNGSVSLPGIEAYVRKADVVIGGLDGLPVSDETLEKRLKKDPNVFSTSTALLATLKDSRLGIVPLANRWAADYGVAGLVESMSNLGSVGMTAAGVRTTQDGSAVAMFPVKGKTVCVHSYSFGLLTPFGGSDKGLVNVVGFNSPGADLSAVQADLQSVKDKCGLNILYLHWGGEKQQLALDHIKGYARKMAAMGADLIVGNFPRYVQDFQMVRLKGKDGELDREVPVFYSLGKLVDSRARTPEMRASALVVANYNIKDARLEVSYAPMFQTKSGDGYKVSDLSDKAGECADENTAECRKVRTAWCYLKDSLAKVKPMSPAEGIDCKKAED